MPGVDLLAADASRTRTVHIQVKTRTIGTWHSNTGRAQERAPVEDELTFWVLGYTVVCLRGHSLQAFVKVGDGVTS